MSDEPDPAKLDVDARFLLANERTLLAWMRTALTLLAAGAAVEQLADRLPGHTVLAVALLVVGIASAIAGALRHARADAALRAGRLPATGRSPYVLAGSVGALGLGLLVALLVA